MKLLLNSVPFAPAVGGIETVSAILAEELTRLGCEVVVNTQTAAAQPHDAPYRIVRQASTGTLLELTRWADVVFHNNISLRCAWPLMLLAKPWMIAHHTWLPSTGRGALAGRLKRLAGRRATHVAISQAMAEHIAHPCTIIPNPYDDSLFRVETGAPRTRELIFVGRLVSDKGVRVLIEALALLAQRGQHPLLTIVGAGPEQQPLRDQVHALQLGAQVQFAGQLTGSALVAALNQHQLMAIPSVWDEPFGIVALEGIACGVVPVASRAGGLPDAVGQCGVVVKKNDALALADGLAPLLRDRQAQQRLLSHAPAHLARHTKAAVGRAYLAALQATAKRHAKTDAPRKGDA